MHLQNPIYHFAKLNDSEGEACETQVWVEFARRCEYLEDEICQELDATYDEIMGQLVELATIKSDWAFSEEQEKWLELIRRHLTENLITEKDDVDSMPIFFQEGASWGKLNKVFGGELETIIHEINTAIAA